VPFMPAVVAHFDSLSYQAAPTPQFPTPIV
jgi:hypothetical protein